MTSERSCKPLLPFSAAMLVSLLLVGLAAAAGDDNSGFTSRGAGTYLLAGTLDAPAPPVLPGRFAAMMVLGRDGSVVEKESFEPPNQDLSPGIGAWEIVDQAERRARIRFLIFGMDGAGMHQTTARVTVHATFSPDWQTFNGRFENEVFLPSQDPLNADEIPVFTVRGELNGRRFTAQDL